MEKESYQTRLDHLEQHFDYSLEFLKEPQKILTTTFSYQNDRNEECFATGYRVQFNNTLGPTKGGLRFHASVTIAESTELAFLMTLKTALLGLALGGAKGGIAIDPKKLSETEIERLTRSFTRQMISFIGPETDIPAPDVNTTSEIMGYIRSEYETITGKTSPGIVTGKEVDNGGIPGRDTSTATGAFHILEKYFSDRNKEPEEMTVAIQGFGNSGSHLARLLDEAGYKIVAVSDSSIALYNEDGLDILALMEWKNGHSFLDFEDEAVKKISQADLLSSDVDVLIPAALGHVITTENVADVKAKIVMEVANAPIDMAADPILKKNNVTVIPDILANAGGVVVSYFEWLQNQNDTDWDEEKVSHNLQEKMLNAAEKVFALAKEKSVTNRTAAYILAINNIHESRSTNNS